MERSTEVYLNLLRDYNDLQKTSTLTITGDSLTIPKVVVASNNKEMKWRITEEVEELLVKNREYLEATLDKGTIIYGINTGYGGSADVRSRDALQIQYAAVQHLKAGFGEKLRPGVVRGVMAIRANSLSRGYSGVRPNIVHCLLQMLNEDVIPVVPKRGSISASGDLMPSAYIAAAMMGKVDSKVSVKGGELVSALEAFQQTGIETVEFQAKEALAVVNSAVFADSLGSIVLFDASIALLLTQVCTAMTTESLLGKLESFNPTIHELMPHKGQKEAAANIARMLEGSQLSVQLLDMDRVDCDGVLKQDRYALRTAPQWLGPTVEVLAESIRRITIDLNSVTDNPIVDHREEKIIHGGNFQGTSATVAMDQARQAIQLCGRLLFAQMSEMLNVKMSNGLAPNLCGTHPSLDYGMKGMDTAMASYMSELNYLTAPISNHVLSAEMHNQSVNSLALISARLTSEALEVLQMMISNILLAHAQAIDLRWLQQQTHKEIQACASANNVEVTNNVSWYELVANNKGNFINSKEEDRKSLAKLHKLVSGKLDSVYQDLIKKQRTKEVAQCLGKGTSQVYQWLRVELGLPFYTGQTPLDEHLQTIFSAVRTRRVADLILNIF